MDFVQTVTNARRVSVPLMYIVTRDPIHLFNRLLDGSAFNRFDTPQPTPIVAWDPVSGVQAHGEHSVISLNTALGPQLQQPGQQPEPAIAQAVTKEIVTALNVVRRTPALTIAFFTTLVPGTVFTTATVQHIWNLRNELKKNGRILIFAGPDLEMPISLAGHIMKIREPLPTLPELEKIVEVQHDNVKEACPDLPDLTPEKKTKAAQAIQGLMPFEGETNVAMAYTPKGINMRVLRQLRQASIDEIQGLQVWKGPENFGAIGGLQGAKDILKGIANANLAFGDTIRKPGGIFFIDEIDKANVGTGGGDLSGMADHILGRFLSFMEDNKIWGILLLGPPGTGKTDITKALGNETDLITIGVNLNRTKSKFMGSTEENLERVLDLSMAVSGGQPLFLASCNSDAGISGALLRRFSVARMYFDLPKSETKKKIWSIKSRHYGLPEQELPNDDFYTGSDINTCCLRAKIFNKPLIEVARTVAPVAKSKPGDIQELRKAADGNYTCADTGLIFNAIEAEQLIAPQPLANSRSGKRSINIPSA